MAIFANDHSGRCASRHAALVGAVRDRYAIGEMVDHLSPGKAPRAKTVSGCGSAFVALAARVARVVVLMG